METVYEAFVKSATTPGAENRMRPDIDPYIERGYIPLGVYAADLSGDNAVSHALEYYVADYALSVLADSLGHKEDAERFRRASLGYRHYYCPEYGTLRPLMADGSFYSPFDPRQGENFETAPGFHEGSAWNYTFYVPHDVKGLAGLMGGKRKFVEKLQMVFDEGLYDPANEPDIAYPYLFSYFPGEEWRTQKTVRELLEKYYRAAPDGIPGNDDTGTMSAWAVFSMMGFYPDCPGNPSYTLTVPAFDRVEIELEPDYAGGHDILVIENRVRDGYSSRVKAGEKYIKGFRISHSDLLEAGTVIFWGQVICLEQIYVMSGGHDQPLWQALAGVLPEGFNTVVMEALCAAQAQQETIATRKASQRALDALAPALPELLGGSADLTGSNLTNWKGVERLTHDNMLGRHISYGVREFGMSAIQNGIALYGGFIPFSGTFLTFSDYARNAVRMAALMKIRSIFVYTHDSIGLGEDGPTHQSIEHVSSLRLIPNLDVWRPADPIESIVAWASAIERKDGPSALVFSRQNVAFVDRDEVDADAIARGGYIAAEAPAGADKVQAVIVATGSEVELAMQTRKLLTAQNVQVRVVSMPCADIFDRQDEAWKESVLPKGVAVLAIEAGTTGLWHKYLRGKGDVVGIDCFGESAPAAVLWKHFGFTVERCVQKVLALLAE